MLSALSATCAPTGVFKPGMQLHPFVGQERRVGREDAVLRAQGDQLVDQLLVLAVEVDLVDQVAKPAHDPEPLDEVMARSTADARKLGRKFTRHAVSPPTLPSTRIVVLPDWR